MLTKPVIYKCAFLNLAGANELMISSKFNLTFKFSRIFEKS